MNISRPLGSFVQRVCKRGCTSTPGSQKIFAWPSQRALGSLYQQSPTLRRLPWFYPYLFVSGHSPGKADETFGGESQSGSELESWKF